MMKKSTKMILMLMVLAIAVCGGLIYRRISEKGYFAFSVTGCSGESYYEDSGTGYLAVKIEALGRERTKTFQVEDGEARTKLSSINVKEIIGVSFSCNIPSREVRDNHLDVERINPIELLLQTDAYDDYFVITDVYTDDAP